MRVSILGDWEIDCSCIKHDKGVLACMCFHIVIVPFTLTMLTIHSLFACH